MRTNLSRRDFVGGAAASGLMFAFGSVSNSLTAMAGQPLLLEAKAGTVKLLDDAGKTTSIWGYGGGVPGPLIRVRRGDEVWVQLKNSLSQPTTIHWHGIRIDNAMDGVANLTQKAIEPGEMFDYRFKVPDGGTFWYHPHNLSWEQVARGLYGALIVEEAEAPDVDQDIVMIADDWRLNENGGIDEEGFGSIGERAHAGRLGNVLTINGKPTEAFEVRTGERNRLRVINTCNARILELRFEDLAPSVIAVDGQPVPPYLLKHGLLTIAPAQRVDLAIEMTGAAGSSQAITEVSGSRLVAATFEYVDAEPVKRRSSHLALPSNGLVVPEMKGARKVDLIMTGGAMGRATEMTYKGKAFGMRDLVQQHGLVWAFNGNAGMPEAPLFSARRGESIAVRMVNNTRWPHAMHLHGHHFREEPANSPWRDTLLMEAGETRTVYLLADNPGKWMLHCHMLEHQAGGMATWFEVA
jgi:FtsP/CotA-like multicopper oxidase with cupredoxin domain